MVFASSLARRLIGASMLLLTLATAIPCPAEPIRGRVAARDGRPLLLADDLPLFSSYCDRFPWGQRLHARNQAFASRGVDLFQLQLRGDSPDFYTTPFWTDHNVYGDEDATRFASLENQAQAILQANPQAVFCVAMFHAPPQNWAERFADQLQTDENGKTYRAASYGSATFREELVQCIRRVVTYVESRSWGGRVIGYVIIPHTEGITEMSVYGFMFDQCAAMQERFAGYVRDKYGSDEALQQAWGDAGASLATVRVPRDSQWRADRANWLTWPKPQQTARYRDYFLLQRDLLHGYIDTVVRAYKQAASRDVFVTVDALKQPLSGWPIADAFEARGDGPEFPDILLAAGSIDMGRTLDLPHLDGLMTPADYTARSVGFGFDGEGIGDSLVLRGKTFMLEDDARSWIKPGFADEQGAWRDVAEGRAGLTRNFACAASRGFFSHWANVSQGYFDDDAVMALIGEVISLRRKTMAAPLVHSQHAIAMIIDDESSLHTDFTSGFQQLAVIQQRNSELALTGLPYRVFLFSDLHRDDFPKFRAYLFPNLFRLDAQRIELLRRKVLRDGAVAIFGPGTGITDGQTVGAAMASELLGFPLEMVELKGSRRVIVHAGAHRALANVREPMVYGDSYAYGPILQPAFELPAPAVELGKSSIYWKSNRAGLVLRELGQGAAGNGQGGARGPGDAAVVFSTAMPIPAGLLRSLALYGGCVPWSDQGDVVFANGRFLAVHSVRPGPRRVVLPFRARVINLATQQVVCEAASEFSVMLRSPDTQVYALEPQGDR